MRAGSVIRALHHLAGRVDSVVMAVPFCLAGGSGWVAGRSAGVRLATGSARSFFGSAVEAVAGCRGGGDAAGALVRSAVVALATRDA
jgi:hypothetical protein